MSRSTADGVLTDLTSAILPSSLQPPFTVAPISLTTYAQNNGLLFLFQGLVQPGSRGRRHSGHTIL